MPQAILDYSGDEIRIKTPYDPQFVAELKMRVPGNYRRWESTERTWWVDHCYGEDVDLLCRHYWSVQRIGLPAEISVQPWWCAILFIQPDAPTEVIKAAYRVLAKAYHPDPNHDPDSGERMRRLTEAYDAVMAERSADAA